MTKSLTRLMIMMELVEHPWFHPVSHWFSREVLPDMKYTTINAPHLGKITLKLNILKVFLILYTSDWHQKRPIFKAFYTKQATKGRNRKSPPIPRLMVPTQICSICNCHQSTNFATPCLTSVISRELLSPSVIFLYLPSKSQHNAMQCNAIQCWPFIQLNYLPKRDYNLCYSYDHTN